MKNETCQCCTCGYEWIKGQHGGHSCTDLLLKKIKDISSIEVEIPLRYAVKQRLVFLDFLLFQYGNINRSALMTFFGISKPQSANDIKMYMKIAPDNIRYNLSEKVYKVNPEFKRVWG